MTNYQAVNRQSSKAFDIHELCAYPPSTSQCPFNCLLKDLVAANSLSTLAVPEEMGQSLLKVTFCHSRGGGSVVCGDNNQLVITVQWLCVCVKNEGPVKGVDRFARWEYML